MTTTEQLLDRLNQLSASEKSQWQEQAKYRAENKIWLKKSQKIALLVLDRIDELKITQKELAIRVDVSPQHINKILRGSENLTLETISRLEAALSFEIFPNSVFYKYSQVLPSGVTGIIKTPVPAPEKHKVRNPETASQPNMYVLAS